MNEDKTKWFEYFRNLLGIPAGQTVLDIETDTCFFAAMAVELGFLVTTVDTTGQIPFADESFDYILDNGTLWTLENPDTSLKEWKRALKKGGQILSFVRLTEPKSCIAAELMEKCHECGFTKVDLVKLPGISVDADIYGEWHVLRATKEQYEQNQAIDAISGFWNRRSLTYDAQHELTSVESWKKHLEELVGTDRSVRIIDLATGTGMIANLLGSMGYTNVTGMDISEGMMDIARKHAGEKNTGVSFVYGNALELPLEESSVDVLINCRLLWTLLEPQKAIAEWIRVAKPGGTVIALHEMEEKYDLDEDQVWQHFLYGKNADPYMELNHATKAEYLELFENSGLKQVKLVHMDGCQTLENGRNNWYALVGYKEI